MSKINGTPPKLRTKGRSPIRDHHATAPRYTALARSTRGPATRNAMGRKRDWKIALQFSNPFFFFKGPLNRSPSAARKRGVSRRRIEPVEMGKI
jgi:hypothetical protein